MFIKELARELYEPENLDRAIRVLRCVFSALRERLTIEESFHVISQLPMLIKAIYVDGWQPMKETEKIRRVDDFVEHVLSFDRQAEPDFGRPQEAREKVQKTFKVLKRHLSTGEQRDIESTLPRPLREFWDQA